MLVDAAVNRRTGQDPDIDAGAVDIGKPPGVVPRRQSRTGPCGEQFPLLLLSQRNRVGIEGFRRTKKSAWKSMTMEINFHCGTHPCAGVRNSSEPKFSNPMTITDVMQLMKLGCARFARLIPGSPRCDPCDDSSDAEGQPDSDVSDRPALAFQSRGDRQLVRVPACGGV